MDPSTASSHRPVFRAPDRVVAATLLVVTLLGGLVLATVDPITLATYLPFAAVGGFLLYRRPRNAIGWLLIAIGFVFIGTSTPPGLDVEGLATGTASFRDMAHAWVATWAGSASFLLYAAVAMVFPSGRLPAGPWGRVAAGVLAVGIGLAALPAFATTLRFSPDGTTDVAVPNPVGFLPDPGAEAVPALQVLVTVVPLAILAGAVVSLLVRYRHTTGTEALQIRWLLASVALVITSVVIGLIGFVLSDMTAGFVWIPALLAYPTVPLAVGVAVMRYRLFDIDRLISRTIAYALVTAVLAALFGGVNLALQASLGSVVRGDAIGVAVSTLIVAALFQPVRGRLQRVVDRRFHRARLDQERVVERLAQDLRDEVDVDRLLGRVADAVVDTMQPTTIAVWRRAAGHGP